MADEISVDLTTKEWELIVWTFERFKNSKEYRNRYTEKDKDDFDKLIEKIKRLLEK